MKSSGKTDSLGIGLKLDLFSSLLKRLILSDSPLGSTFKTSRILLHNVFLHFDKIFMRS